MTANGQDDTVAAVTPGAGGLVAGVSARPYTSSTSRTYAGLGSPAPGAASTITLTTGSGSLSVKAQHTSTFNAKVVATAVGLVSGAGADVDNDIDSIVETRIGAGVIVNAKSIDIGATNIVDQPSLLGGANIKATAGGLVSGAGANVDTTIHRLETVVNIMGNAQLTVLGVVSNNDVFTVRALNVINSYNKATFTTGGAVSGADAVVVFRANSPIALVRVHPGAQLKSPGALELSARTNGIVNALIGTDTYGAGTVTGGSALVEVRPDNRVDIQASSGSPTLVEAFGNLNVLTGRSSVASLLDSSDVYHIAARYDAFAGSLIPISDIDAAAWLLVENFIDIAQHVTLRSSRTMNLYAGSTLVGSIESKAKATSWISEAGSAIFGLLGGSGEVGYTADTMAEAHAYVTHNGRIETGQNRHQRLHITGWNRVTGTVTVSPDSSAAITYTTDFKALTSALVEELNSARAALAQFGPTNAALKAYYEGEIARIQEELEDLGLLDPNGGSPLPTDQEVLTVTVNPVWAQGGKIDVRTDQLRGNGVMIAPTDASITILNDTPAFLEILGATIPEISGGLFFNGKLLPTATRAETLTGIQNENNFQAGDDNYQGNGQDPTVVVVAPNFTFDFGTPGPAGGPKIEIKNTKHVSEINETDENNEPVIYPWPNLTVLGPDECVGTGVDRVCGQGIFNDGGSVHLETLAAGKGDVVIHGTVRAKNLVVVAGGDVNIVGVTAYEVGGSPAAQIGDATEDEYGAGAARAPGVTRAFDCFELQHARRAQRPHRLPQRHQARLAPEGLVLGRDQQLRHRAVQPLRRPHPHRGRVHQRQRHHAERP